MLLCLSAAVLGGCAGGGGGGSLAGSDEASIGIALSMAGSPGRAARSAIPDGDISVTLESESGYSQSQVTRIENGRGTLTFSDVPVGYKATASATLIDVDGTTYSGSASAVVQGSGTTLNITMREVPWTIPLNFSVTADCDLLKSGNDYIYCGTLSYVTLTVNGLTVPERLSSDVTYSWQINGNEFCTTREPMQQFISSAGDEITYTLTVTYNGVSVSRSASLLARAPIVDDIKSRVSVTKAERPNGSGCAVEFTLTAEGTTLFDLLTTSNAPKIKIYSDNNPSGREFTTSDAVAIGGSVVKIVTIAASYTNGSQSCGSMTFTNMNNITAIFKMGDTDIISTPVPN